MRSWQALTADQINAAIKRHIDVSAVSIVKAGDFNRPTGQKARLKLADHFRPGSNLLVVCTTIFFCFTVRAMRRKPDEPVLSEV